MKVIYIIALVALSFVLIPNPVMGMISSSGFVPTHTNYDTIQQTIPITNSVPNYAYGSAPKPTYVEQHYGIITCDAAFQYKFLCDRLDVMIQQNDQIISNENTITSQNEQVIHATQAQICMTGYAGHSNFLDYAKNLGVDCNKLAGAKP